jgi:hypothetical protein
MEVHLFREEGHDSERYGRWRHQLDRQIYERPTRTPAGNAPVPLLSNHGDWRVAELNTSYGVPAEIMEFAAHLARMVALPCPTRRPYAKSARTPSGRWRPSRGSNSTTLSLKPPDSSAQATGKPVLRGGHRPRRLRPVRRNQPVSGSGRRDHRRTTGGHGCPGRRPGQGRGTRPRPRRRTRHHRQPRRLACASSTPPSLAASLVMHKSRVRIRLPATPARGSQALVGRSGPGTFRGLSALSRRRSRDFSLSKREMP